MAGFAIVAAINTALDEAARAGEAQLPQPPDGIFDADVAAVDHGPDGPPEEYEGASDDTRVVAKVSATAHRITSFYMEDLSAEVVAQVPIAVNRALTASFTGDPDVAPLDEDFEGITDDLSRTLRKLEDDLALAEVRIAQAGSGN